MKVAERVIEAKAETVIFSPRESGATPIASCARGAGWCGALPEDAVLEMRHAVGLA